MMTNLILFAGFSGITVFIGGLLANYFNHHVPESPIKYEVTHLLMSYGAGIILSALALVLIPTGMKSLDILPLSISFLAGTLLFIYIDLLLSKQSGQTASLLAMLMDFIPESIALGALFAVDDNMAALLAIFIGLQNLPEAFNSFRDLVQSGYSVKATLTVFFCLSFCGIIGALTGHYLLSDHPTLTAHMMIFASGGILYLLFQDIIPQSKLENNHLTAIGASFGFLTGMIGDMLI